jgi:hypothetical protein
MDIDLNKSPDENGINLNCKNCMTIFTSRWRNGYCNACATYFYKHGYLKNPVEIYATVLINMSKNKLT